MISYNGKSSPDKVLQNLLSLSSLNLTCFNCLFSEVYVSIDLNKYTISPNILFLFINLFNFNNYFSLVRGVTDLESIPRNDGRNTP